MIFIPIPQYEHLYEINSSGLVRHRKFHRLIKPRVNNAGYQRVTLSKNGVARSFFVHRLVAHCFLPIPRHDKKQVNHKNGIKTDNFLDNLEWVTASENQKHSFSYLDRKRPKAWLGKFGSAHPNSKPILQLKNDTLVEFWDSIADAGRSGFSVPNISACLNGRRKSCGGYTWKYATIEQESRL